MEILLILANKVGKHLVLGAFLLVKCFVDGVFSELGDDDIIVVVFYVKCFVFYCDFYLIIFNKNVDIGCGFW